MRFAYGERYLERPERISLYDDELPLRSGSQGPPAGLDIAGCLNDAGPDSWGRTVIVNRLVGRGAELDRLDDLTYLLESGSDRIGALDFQRSATDYEERGSQASLSELVRAAELIQDGRRLPVELEQALRAGSSAGGARPKALLRDGGRSLIAKFEANNDGYPIVRFEFVAMRMAAACGLDVAGVSLARAENRDVLLVERFDRVGEQRRQMLSALTLLGLHESQTSLASYGKLAEIMRARFVEPTHARRELFGRMVFNVLCGNTDDHARNHAAFWDGHMLTLTPAYDICPLPRGGGEAQQAMRLGAADDPDRLSQLIRCVKRSSLFGLSETEAREIIDRQRGVIEERFDQLCDEAELAEIHRETLRNVFPNPYVLHDYES